ncbi:MAG: type II toxin-antitoxin system VapC family toxin [Chloroflexi bacterium]|nr:type II toxin-antitoxin system VapC family toxin [Chloroflexota bacterium]
MITAVDSSVLIDVLSDDPHFSDRSVHAIQEARTHGGIVACEVVWAEVAGWGPSPDAVLDLLDRMGIDFVPMTRQASLAAGTSLARYRRSGGTRDRVVADFLIAAHALLQADRLLTRDRGFYRRHFTDLVVIDPSED